MSTFSRNWQNRAIAALTAALMVMPLSMHISPVASVSAARGPLEISISDGLTYAQPNEKLHYHILVHNPTDRVQDFELRAEIPTETAVTDVRGPHNLTRAAVEWDEVEILPGETLEFRFAVRVDEDAVDYVSLRSRASAGSNSDTDTTTVYAGFLPVALDVAVTDDREEVAPGQEYDYTILLANTSDQLATEIDVNNALPQFVEYVSSSDGGHWEGKNVRWTGLTVSPHGTRTLHVRGRVRSDAPLGAQLRNVTLANGSEGVDISTVQGGHATRTTSVSPIRHTVFVSKDMSRSEVRPGSTIPVRITVQNVTDQPLYNVRIEDRLNSPYLTVSDITQLGQHADKRILWEAPVLEPGQRYVVGYSVAVASYAPHGTNIATVVTVRGDGMEDYSLSDRIYVSAISIVNNLPPTGVPMDTIFVGMIAALASVFTVVQRRMLGLV